MPQTTQDKTAIEQIKLWLFPILFSIASLTIVNKLNSTEQKLELLLERTARLEEKIVGEQRINSEFRQSTEKRFSTILGAHSMLFNKPEQLTFDSKTQKYVYI